MGRAVRTTGRLVAVNAGALSFDLALEQGRARLRLEPEAKAVLVARAAAWEGKPVEVEGLFYRDAVEGAAASYALRAWRVRSPSEAAAPRPKPAAEPLALARGPRLRERQARREARARCAARTAARTATGTCPRPAARARGDWVLKDGHFAAWITGREAYAETAPVEATRSHRRHGGGALKVVGTPTTSGGVVRIAAREVGLSRRRRLPRPSAARQAPATPAGGPCPRG